MKLSSGASYTLLRNGARSEGNSWRSTEVHHTEPHRGDVDKFWNGPFLSTCRSCHSSRGQREDLGQIVVTFDASGWPAEG